MVVAALALVMVSFADALGNKNRDGFKPKGKREAMGMGAGQGAGR